MTEITINMQWQWQWLWHALVLVLVLALAVAVAVASRSFQFLEFIERMKISTFQCYPCTQHMRRMRNVILGVGSGWGGGVVVCSASFPDVS